MGYLELLRQGVRNPTQVPGYARTIFSRLTWRLWELLGFHLVPDHYYYPVPNFAALRDTEWNRRYTTEGVEMNPERQTELVTEFAKYESEYDDLETVGPAPNGDGAVYYSLLREIEPRRIVEVGAGKSTNVALAATRRNDAVCDLTAVDPHPNRYLVQLAAGNDELTLLERRAQDLDPSWYCQLEAGDVLFVDSSHVVQVGGDVVHLFLRVLPRIPPGVYVHVHDVKFPYEYSEEWVLGKHYFWQERYLLHAFLLFNDAFEVVWATKFMAEQHRDHLVENLPGFDAENGTGGSFWVRRVE